MSRCGAVRLRPREEPEGASRGDGKINEGADNFRLHYLRHDFASMLVQKGQSLYQTQLLMGQRDSRMTQRYAHLRVDDLRKAVEVLG